MGCIAMTIIFMIFRLYRFYFNALNNAGKF